MNDDNTKTATLSDLPLDILQDSLLPLLNSSDLARLSTTSTSFHRLVQGPEGEIVWKRKIADEFSFPTQNTGRQQGWRELYRRLQHQSLFVWGQNGNGRLGLSPNDPRARRILVQDGLTLPTRLHVPASLVGLEAGGWSFHALSMEGKVLSWGTMDGEQWVSPAGAVLSHPGAVAHVPFVLPASGRMGEVVQLECGRKHVVARNKAGEVWEYYSFGRAYRVVDAAGAWGVGVGRGKEVRAVAAGWAHSAVLTEGGSAFIWWEFGPGKLAKLANEAGEAQLEDPQKEGVTFVVEAETTRLPDLPISRNGPQDDKIVMLACMDHQVLALTRNSALYLVDTSPVPLPNQPLAPHGSEDPDDSPVRSFASRARLEAAFVSGQRRWELMRHFYDIDEIRKLEAFAQEGDEATAKITPPPLSTRINHISAHFHSFVVYSVPTSSEDSSSSIVLLGTDESTVESLPQVIPELQGKSVIKVVFGDYHSLALTSSGHLLSWGSYSSGALGLGHPQLPNTPLSAPRPPIPFNENEGGLPIPYPLPRVGRPRDPGFTRGTIAAPPTRVERPTLVRFVGEKEGGEEGERREGKFVFVVCAGGWHSGCLAVELGEGEGEGEEKQVEGVERGETEGEVVPLFRGMGGRPPFRIGYAGRGRMRGAGPAEM